MAETTAHGWTILNRGKGVWSYEYGFAKGATANCLVARMPDGKLLVLSPASQLSEGAFGDLEQLGEVGAVVATNGFHHLGQASWRKRYPNARFFAPSQATARIHKKNPEAGPLEPLSELTPLLGTDLVVREAPSTKCGETWAIIKVDGGHIWYVSDILANIPVLPSSLIPKLLFKWTKSAPGYRVFNLALQFIVKDKKAVLSEMLADLDRFPPTMVVPAHGVPVTGTQALTETRAILQAAI